jgi:hypothetical protein
VKSGIQLKTEPTCALAGSGSGSQDSLAETVKQNIYRYSQSKVIIDQTGNRRSEDVEGEKAPGNKLLVSNKSTGLSSARMYFKKKSCEEPKLGGEH